MEVRRVKYGTWAELRKEALRLEKLGFICEVKGWADISTNTLTVSIETKETGENDSRKTVTPEN